MSSSLPPGVLLRQTLRPYHRTIAIGLLFTLLGAGLTLAWPRVLQQAIDGLSTGEAIGRLHWFALTVLALASGEAVCRFSMRYLMSSVSRRAEFDLRERLFGHLVRLDATFYQQARTGDLMARATNDISAVRQLLGPGIQTLFNTLILFCFALAMMSTISPSLTVGAALLLPCISLVFGLFRRQIEVRASAIQAQFAALNAQAEENLAGIRVVKAYAQEEREIEAFRQASMAYLVREMAQVRLSGLLWPLMSTLAGLGSVMVLYLGGRAVIDGELTLGQYVQFGAYLAMLTWPMVALGWVLNLFQEGVAALKRVAAVLETEPLVGERVSGGAGERESKGAIEYEHVSLTLNGTSLLRDCSFAIPAGGFLGVVGPTGSGKSLLLALLARVYDPTAGRILLDGRDLRDWPLAELRQAIGFVPQETILFSESLRENVALGVAEPASDQLERAVALAQLEQDLPQLPNGLETVIGERGVTLSGGQKQRTAIARALLKDPRILVLDDALSSVDTSTEAAILQGLRGFMRGRTSVVATHRLSVVREADLILVLDDGRIVERGTHAELLALGGLYARLERRQRLEEELKDEEQEDRVGRTNGRERGSTVPR